MPTNSNLAVFFISFMSLNEIPSVIVKPVVMMLSRCLMEEVEQSGRRIVGEVQQGVERRGRRFGLNKDRRVLTLLSHPSIDIFSVLKDE